MNNREIQKLKDNLSVFDIVTIHGQHLELNIASSNKGIREESYRQYLECLDVLEAKELITFLWNRDDEIPLDIKPWRILEYIRKLEKK